MLDLTGAVLVTDEGARALAGCTELREAVLTWCAAFNLNPLRSHCCACATPATGAAPLVFSFRFLPG